MKTIGVLFGKQLNKENTPFSEDKLNKDYAFFTDIGSKRGFKVVVGMLKDFQKNKVLKAWYYENGWKIIKDVNISIIFDRSTTDIKTHKSKKKISKNIPIINNPELNRICWDKGSYIDFFSEYIPKTFLVNNRKELDKVLGKIKSDKIVLKPRFGIMGKDISIVDKKNIPSKIKPNTIVQEFIDTSSGIKELDIKCIHDIRVVLINHEIDHCYIRKSTGKMVSNIAQGGIVEHIPNEKIPKSVLDIVKKVTAKIKKFGPAVYTVDCVFPKNQKPILIELESIPVIGSAYIDKEAKPVQESFINHIFDTFETLLK